MGEVFVVTMWADHEGEQPVGVAADLDTAKRMAVEDFEVTYPPHDPRGHALTDWDHDGERQWDAGVTTPGGWPPMHGYFIREVTVRG